MQRATFSDETLREWVVSARARTVAQVADLSEEQLAVPFLPTLNPLLWELCHAAYFAEYWVLRQGGGREPCRPDVDELFDSIHIGHETRWRLPLPDRAGALEYVHEVRDRILAAIDAGVDERARYLIAYAVFHEDMHAEALAYARQTLGYAAPPLERAVKRAGGDPSAVELGDAGVAGGLLELGAARDVPFCFDNEKWAHAVRIEPFAIARAAVTEGRFADFVSDGGYERPELWSPAGWAARQAVQAALPLFWRRDGESGGFERRRFDRWEPLDERAAMMHVSWFEADAWCRWAGRRLPTEAEWEAAAALSDDGKRAQPWGSAPAGPEHANLDFAHGGAVDAHALAAGDSASGCRQMIGNVWEWTDTTFEAYPGFVADMYHDYSTTSFHTRKVLRGGCWATSSRLIRNTWRNYYPATRRDVFAGFRTCALG